jgi:hypothetical protein
MELKNITASEFDSGDDIGRGRSETQFQRRVGTLHSSITTQKLGSLEIGFLTIHKLRLAITSAEE